MVVSSSAPVQRIAVRGPFALDRALDFLNGFAPADAGGLTAEYQRAHVLHGRPLLVRMAQPAPDEVAVRVAGVGVTAADLDAAARLVRRMFSLDRDGATFYAQVGAADPVLAALQQAFSGLRPVLFGSPFEALCWAILGQRISMRQAAALKARLAEAFGPIVTVDGTPHRAFPAPGHLLGLDPVTDAARLRIPAPKLERLRLLAERGVAGDLEAEMLLAMPPAEAREWLQRSPGVGPWASELALIRGAGHPDLLPRGERRLPAAIRDAYGLAHEPTRAEVERLAARWAGFRAWAAFLLRVALEQAAGEARHPICGAQPAPAAAR